MGCALATHPGSFSATLESSIVSGSSPLRMGTDSHEGSATLRAYDSISLGCSYCCSGGLCQFLTKLTQVN